MSGKADPVETMLAYMEDKKDYIELLELKDGVTDRENDKIYEDAVKLVDNLIRQGLCHEWPIGRRPNYADRAVKQQKGKKLLKLAVPLTLDHLIGTDIGNALWKIGPFQGHHSYEN